MHPARHPLPMLLAAAFAFVACSEADHSKVSNVKADETIEFFRTAAWLSDSGDAWYVPIHGWIYEPQDSTSRRAFTEQILKEQFNLVVTDATRSNFAERVNLLIADNERGKDIVITLAGRQYELPPSAPNGHFAAELEIPLAEVEAHVTNGFLNYVAVTEAGDPREFLGSVRLVSRTGLSVISDIDDTVKISNVTDRRSLLEYAFLEDFIAAPGMAQRYQSWASRDASFHFVSSSPWQLYAPLRVFLDDAGFPWATFSLKLVRFRDESLFNLFKKGTETKPDAIEPIINRYPERTFILVGDSGEQDPEVYAALMRKYPERIEQVLIRNVTGETMDNERFAALFEAIPAERWLLFDEPEVGN